MSNIPKVHRLATLLQQQQAIKLLEQLSRWLMDSAENSLSGISETAKERHDSPGRLGVETGGRFVEEEEELGLGCELDTDGGALAVLDTEGSDDGISVSGEAAHLQTFLDASPPCQPCQPQKHEKKK